ncbi:glutamyl-tRNA reductase [Arsenophonus symbiont of Ornithomya chloropus]|uniref:glutamyl-tRNA reductase n=1 Tax=Arsenophonus symbiont of Ornithomya chloropus TaxID=634121 RepID=UPI0032B271DD
MTLFALGINHKTAPITLRERLIIGAEKIEHVLDNLLKQSFVHSGVVLSTCNRTEVYLVVDLHDILHDKLMNWFCSYHSLNLNDVRKSIYWYQDNAVVNHLMRVTSGLDSLALGEPQILGQVKKAFLKSQHYKKLSSELERLFQHAFFVAKRIRTETKIGANAVSIAFVACRLVCQIFKSLSELNILLIGAGETIELTVRHLLKCHAKHVIIANRTPERALRIAKIIGAEFINLSDLDTRLAEADIVISSTASPVPIIGEVMVKRAMKVRHNKFMLLIDIAVPRDIEQNVKKLNNIYLYSIDDLEFIITENIKKRKIAVIQAESIIQKESADFMQWLRSQSLIKIIRNYRRQSEKMRVLMVEKALSTLNNGENSELVINKLTYQLMNRLMHAPTKSLRQAVLDGDINRFNILKDSLGLEKN